MSSISGNLISRLLPDWIELVILGIIVLLICGTLVWKVYNFCNGLFAGSRKNTGFTQLNDPQKTQLVPPYQRY
jgi:hypothetical protein